jgi:hypothetical protein
MLLRKPEKALDWQGREVCCTGCVHRELIREDRCRQKHVCVQDRSPSRIEEFFKINPAWPTIFFRIPISKCARQRPNMPMSSG